MYHIYQKLPEIVYIILVLVNTLATCGNVECLFYGTILLIYFMKNECGLHLLPKITYEHIKLTSYSIMNVKLAAKVLSSTVSNVLSNYSSPDAVKTAKFCLLMDTL